MQLLISFPARLFNKAHSTRERRMNLLSAPRNDSSMGTHLLSYALASQSLNCEYVQRPFLR